MTQMTPITLNLQAPNVNVIVHAKEGDRAGRYMNARLVDGATAFIPPQNAYFAVRYMKADGNGGLYDTMEDNVTPAVTMSGNIATIGIAEQALTLQGRVAMELNIYDHTGTRISAFTFTLMVEETVMPDGNVESTEYFNILTHEIALALQASDVVQAVVDMTVEAVELPAGSTPTVEKDYDPDAGTLKLTFGMVNGVNGKTAYESAVEGGYAGTEAQFNVELAGLNAAATAAQAAAADAAQSKADVQALAETISGSVGIDDDYTGADTTWSSNKINEVVEEVDDRLSESITEISDTVMKAFKQYLYASKKTDGYYYNISNGKVIKGGNGTSSAEIYEPFKLKAGKTYIYSNLYGYFTIIDTNGTLTRLTENQSGAYSGTYTPASDCVIYVTINGEISARRYFIDSFIVPVDGTEGYYYARNKLDNYIRIRVNPSMDIVNVIRNITDSSEENQYIIELEEGTYILYPYLTSEERQGSRWGLKLPNYVHMVGIGDVNKTFVDCTIINPSSSTEVEYTSTLNLEGNNNLENITFRGKNVRYVVHDESSNNKKNWKRIVKNCKFVHNGNDDGYWAYTSAWGEGCSSGSKSEFYDCEFLNKSYVASYAFHTNTSFEKPCHHKFVNCRFDSEYMGYSTQNTTGVFSINDIQSRQPVYVEFIGCSFNGFVFVQNSNSIEDWEDIHISGYGNTPIMWNVYRPDVSNPKPFVTYFSDWNKTVKNTGSETIEKGRPLFYVNASENAVGILQENGIRCCGIAMEDIPPESNGQMQYAGLMQAVMYGINNINYGNKIGVESWSVKETSDNHFAIAPVGGVIKFL